MIDEEKTREQLILELKELRQRLSKGGSLNDAKRLDANDCDHGVVESDPAESEANYHCLFEHSLDAVFLTVPDGSVRAANPAACKMFGMTEEELCRAGRQGLVDTSDPRHAAALEERARTGKLHCELRYVRKDGSKFLAEVSSVILEGRRKSFVILRDITERKRTEDALRESEARYRLLAENATDVIWTVGMDMRLTYISPSVTRLLGFTAEEAMAQTMQQVYTPAAFEKAMKIFAEEMALESAGHGDPNRSRILELELVHKDGNTVLVEGNFSFLRDPAGKAVGILSMVRNITERKLAEDALRESEGKYRSFFENSFDTIFLTVQEKGGEIIAANPEACRMFGYTEEEFCKHGRSGVVDTTDPRCQQLLEERSLRGKARGEMVHIRKDGTKFPTDVSSTMFKDKNGRNLCITIIRDISERMRGDQALRKSEEHYRSLFENMLDGFAYCKMIFENEQPVDFEYLAVNSAFEELTGLKNVTGKKVTEVIPGIRESNPELFEIYARVALTGRPERLETYMPELRIWLIISVYSHEEGSFVAIFDNISDRKKAEEALRLANEELEKRVEERTSALRAKTVDLEEVNTALRVLLDRREEDRKELEGAIAGNLKSLILPYTEKLQRTQLSADQATYLSILQSHLHEIESRFINKLSLQHMGLTPTEMQVAALIKDGKTSKDIAEVLHVSEKAVEFHRNNLRRKLNIRNKKENLRSHLLALS
jgi:PAS domain S-box-containing protein